MGKDPGLTTGRLTFLQLIRSSLWNEERPDQAEDALEEARNQALVPLAFPKNQEAIAHSVKIVRMLFAQDDLAAIMGESNIPMVILKGVAAAVYYPDPFQRTMGDVDLLVPQDRFEEASGLMTANGYVLVQDLDFLGRHRCYRKDGIVFELHHHYSYDEFDVERYVEDGIRHPDMINIAGHMIPILPPLANGMVLLSHVAGHLRNEIGFRQVIDWMMYVDKVADDDFWNNYLSYAARETGLETLAVVMTKMSQLYLGLRQDITWADGAERSLCDDLLMNLFATGNFGRTNGRGSSIETVATTIKRNGLFRTLQTSGEHNWRAYHKHHWLKPFCWFYQIFRYARQGFQSGRNKEQISGDLSRSQLRYNLLTRLGLD